MTIIASIDSSGGAGGGGGGGAAAPASLVLSHQFVGSSPSTGMTGLSPDYGENTWTGANWNLSADGAINSSTGAVLEIDLPTLPPGGGSYAATYVITMDIKSVASYPGGTRGLYLDWGYIDSNNYVACRYASSAWRGRAFVGGVGSAEIACDSIFDAGGNSIEGGKRAVFGLLSQGFFGQVFCGAGPGVNTGGANQYFGDAKNFNYGGALDPTGAKLRIRQDAAAFYVRTINVYALPHS